MCLFLSPDVGGEEILSLPLGPSVEESKTHYLNLPFLPTDVARCSSVVRVFAHGSILHGENPLSYFLFQPVLHDWWNKGCGMCYPVCGRCI